ncbi:MAG: hypothetical protein IID31_11590 [Planctomycetes bacterium]|nr:hypothetical protein [Planctomycetota bacterium]
MPDHKRAGRRSRGCLIPLGIVCLLVAAFVGRVIYLAVTATPGSAVDYHALAEELVASYQPPGDENGWDLLLEAVRLMQDADAQSEHADLLYEGYRYLISPDDYTFADDEPLAEEWEAAGIGVADDEPTAEELRAAGIEGLDALREAGVWDLLDQLAHSPRVIRPLPGQGILFGVLLPELGQTRSLARALGARMRVAHDAGDDADVAAAFVQGCGLARALMHQLTLIDHLTGIAIFALFDGELRYELVERPMDEQSLLIIANALDRLALMPPQLPFEGERLILLDMIQWMHTDDGHGNGRLILSRVGSLPSSTGGVPSSGSRLLNLASIAYPSKKQTTEQTEFIFAAVIKAAQTPRQQRAAIQFDPDTWLDQLPQRQILLHMMLPFIAGPLEARDHFDALLSGTRTMVAIELHNARHGGYPDALEDLVPEFLPTLPTDPFAVDGRFIYRTLDPTSDEFGRSYTLYSVGADQTDDGGLHDRTLGIKAFREGESATDYVFNLPRPDAGD